MGIVIQGGMVVTATDCYQADVRIDGESITAIGYQIEQPGDMWTDAAGCYLFPGGIDPHTHFDLPVGATTTADDFTSGTRAAVLGGTTTIIDFATQNKGESLQQALENWHGKAQRKSFADYGFHLALSEVNPAILAEMPGVVAEQGVTSFKLYMAYKGILQVNDAMLLQVMRVSKECGALVCLHCENGDVIQTLVSEAKSQGYTSPRHHARTRPVLAEQEATFRAVCLAEIAAAPLYVVHVSCGPALDVIRKAQNRGLPVYAETCPQYLLLDETYYTDDFESAKYVLSPPLRPREHQQALWQGLKDGDIAVLASDHCSFNLAGQKELGKDDFAKIPNGAPGVENRFGLLFTYGVVENKINLQQFVQLTSTGAAKLFGLYPRKGTIAVGSDADIVIWDPNVRIRISAANQTQNVDYNPYEGFTQIGKARHVFLRGEQIVVDGKLAHEQPVGKYLARCRHGAGGMDHV